MSEVCDWLSIAEPHLKLLIDFDGFPAVKLGGRKRHLLRFNRASVERWLASREDAE